MAVSNLVAIGLWRILPVTSFRFAEFGQAALQGSWEVISGILAYRACLIPNYKATVKLAAPPFFRQSSNNSGPNVCDFRIGCDAPLEAQTISGDVTFTLMLEEGANPAFNNCRLKIVMWVLQAGTVSTPRGIILDWTSGVQYPTTAVGVSTGALTLTPLAVQAGDSIVIEMGFERLGAYNFPGSVNKTWLSGGALSDGTFVADMTAGSFDATLGTTVQFSVPPTVNLYNPESGDVLAGNVYLSLYDKTTALPMRHVYMPGNGTPAGMSMNSDGTINVGSDVGTAYTSTFLVKYNADLTFNSYLPIGTGIDPHSISNDSNDNKYIGFVGDDGTGCGEGGDVGTPSAPSYAVQKLNAVDVIVDNYAVTPDLAASQAIDLSSDQATLLYTSLGRKVKRYNVSTDLQLTDFVVLPAAVNGEVARGFRILPDGGVLLCDGLDIKRLNNAGVVTQTYTIPASQPPIFISPFYSYATLMTLLGTLNNYVDWGVISIDPSGTSFWAANRAGYNGPGTAMRGILGHYDLASGTMLAYISDTAVLNSGGGFCSGGLMVYGEYRNATSPPPPTPREEYSGLYQLTSSGSQPGSIALSRHDTLVDTNGNNSSLVIPSPSFKTSLIVGEE
jgi:hypothetical protein